MQVRAQLSLLQQALADEKSLCLLPSQPGSGLGNQAGEQSWFRDVLEGALAVLSSNLCPAATAGSHSQMLCAKGWFQLETNPRPLLLPNHFLQRVLSHIQSSNKVLAIALHWKLSKCGSEQGPAFLTVFLLEKQETRLQGAVTSQESSAMSTKMEPKEKKTVLGTEIPDPCS